MQFYSLQDTVPVGGAQEVLCVPMDLHSQKSYEAREKFCKGFPEKIIRTQFLDIKRPKDRPILFLKILFLKYYFQKRFLKNFQALKVF